MPILTQIGFFQNVVVNAGGKPIKVCCRKKNRLTDISLYDASTMWGVAPPPQPREQKFTWTPPSEGRVVALVKWSASLHVTETSTWPGRGPSLRTCMLDAFATRRALWHHQGGWQGHTPSTPQPPLRDPPALFHTEGSDSDLPPQGNLPSLEGSGH